MIDYPQLRVPPWQQGQRWSRTQGALGGREVWARWAQCPMAVIGAGRSGSLLAEALVRTGLRALTADRPRPDRAAQPR